MRRTSFRRLADRHGVDVRHFILGLLCGVSLLGCAGFTYRHYGLDLPSYDGRLLGPTEAQDKPFISCQPDAGNKGKCVVMFADEFFRMRQDYLETKRLLKECQSKSL